MKKLLPVGLLLVCHFVLFGNAYLGLSVFAHRDLIFMHVPMKAEAGSQWSSGQIPTWDDRTLNGQSAVTNPNYAVFYPATQLLYGGLPFQRATRILLIHHLWLLAGCCLLFYRMKAKPLFVFLGTMIIGFSGPMLSAMAYYNMFTALSWIPWFILAWSLSSIRLRFVLSSIILSFIVLAGLPFVAFGCLLLALFHSFLTGQSGWLHAVLMLVFVAVSGILLSAIQIVPSVLYMKQALKSLPIPYAESIAWFSFHPLRTLELCFPHLFGNQLQPLTVDFWGSGLVDGKKSLIFTPYFGLTSIVLVGVVPGRVKKLTLVFSVVLLFLAFGRFAGIHWILTRILIPLRIFRYPEKYLLLLPFLFALAIVSQDILPKIGKKKGVTMILAACVLVFPFIFMIPLLERAVMMTSSGHYPVDSIDKAVDGIRTSLVYGLAMLCALVLSLMMGHGRRFTRVAVGLLFTLDLMAVSFQNLPEMSSDAASRTPLLAARLKQDGCTRVFPMLANEYQLDDEYKLKVDPVYGDFYNFTFQTLFPRVGTLMGISYGLNLPVDQMEAQSTGKLAREFMNPRLVDERILSLMGVSHVVHSSEQPPCRVLWTEPFKGFYLSRLQTPPPLWLRMDDHDFTVIQPDMKTGEGWFSYHFQIPASGIIHTPHTYLTDWRGTLDGQPVCVNPSPWGTMEVQTDPGEHDLRLFYRPAGLLVGMLVSGCWLVVLLCFGLIGSGKTSHISLSSTAIAQILN